MPQQPLKILQASAGSGKTFSLTAHYLTLLLAGENKYREILAVTFTNKATEEMKTRILEVLKGFAEGDPSKEVYRQIVLRAHPQMDAEQLKVLSDKIYRKILHDYSRFSVNTIDGFVQKVIRGFAFELGLDAGYGLELNYDKVKQDLALRLDKALDTNPVLLQWIIDLALDRINNNLSWNYRRELIELANEIFKERYQPFENAIRQLEDSADLDALFKDYNKVTRLGIETFESGIRDLATTGLQILQVEDVDVSMMKGKSRSPLNNLAKIAEGDLTKVAGLSKLIDQPEEWFQKGYAGNVYDELNPVLSDLHRNYQEGLPAYLLALAFNKNLYYLRLMQEMAALLRDYRSESPNLLISDAQNLLRGITDDADGNPSFIWEKMGNRYRHFLFDEFQDTSSNQWGSFKSLLTNAMATATGRLTDHLIVGDTKQSIYRWRNGDWNILHQQAKIDVQLHNVVEESLDENYRSTKNIIAFNNALYGKLPAMMQGSLNAAIEEQETRTILDWWTEKGFDHIVTDVYAQASQKTTPFSPDGGTIHFNVLKEDEAGKALTKVSFRDASLLKMVDEIQVLLDTKGYQPQDICVLVRSNSEAVATVELLMNHGINVISGEALLLSNNSAVKLIINTFYVLGGLAQNTALYKANCLRIYSRLQGKNNLQPEHFFRLKEKTLAQLSGLLPEELCLNWQSWMQQPIPALLEKIIAAYGLNAPEQVHHLPYLLAIRDLAGNFAQHGEKGVASFLNYWDEEGGRKALPSSENTDAVQVITIHKSKGLAFRAVMLPFCNWDVNGKANSIFWVPAADTPYHHLHSIPLKYGKELGRSTVARSYFEELLYNNMDALNMLYVATTRSKEYLYINAMGKKTDTISNIGDLLINVFSDQLTDENSYSIDDPVAGQPVKPKVNDTIELSHYPVSDRLSQVFDASLKRRDIDLVTGENAGRTGTILHEVLARATGPEAIEGVLQQLMLEGVFKKEELEYLKQQALTVLRHEGLQEILNSSDKILNEQSIIDTEGKMYRPDKVLLKDNNVTLIDYKFTQQESERHVEQVSHYRELLRAMGYSEVKAYLFYALTGQLKSV